MKIKLMSILLACAMLLPLAVFTSCSEPAPKEGTVTRMTVDINPSVEFMVDDQNKVVSVTALNDDGSILVAGEAFIGKTPEEAVEMMVTLATETGYLVKGNVEADENTVKISVSGNDKYAEALLAKVEKTADSVMDKLDVKGAVEKVEAMATDGLRALALSTSLYTEEEINAMTDEQLCKVIAAGRVETALLLTEEMRNAYYSAKEYKISFAESEETAKVIEAMGGLYSLTHKAYKAALDLYSTAITELDEFRYDMLVSPESEYQKSLAKLRDAKVELLKQKNYTASLEVDGTEYASATVTLQMTEEQYDKALAAYEELGNRLNSSLESLISTLRQAEAKLRELENTLFDENIKEKLQEKAVEMENNLNAAKDNFFAEFESAHAEDIASIEQSLKDKKQQLKTEIEAAQ
ncbi:MAG: hypothetical protein E7610_09615 [Ruminococcaceae bacterium]|nr:hypothetical protein [Oscillospiraceae bacterium]